MQNCSKLQIGTDELTHADLSYFLKRFGSQTINTVPIVLKHLEAVNVQQANDRVVLGSVILFGERQENLALLKENHEIKIRLKTHIKCFSNKSITRKYSVKYTYSIV